MPLQSEKRKAFKVNERDPLYRIFKKHLYDFQHGSRRSFLEAVIEEYMREMRSEGKIFLFNQEMTRLKQSLEQEVMEMLVRKLHGCLELEKEAYSGEKQKSPRKGEEENRQLIFQKHLQRLLVTE